MPRCIGLDVGSSSIKAAVLDLDSQKIERIASQPFPSPAMSGPRRFEIDVRDVVARARILLESLLAEHPDCDRMLTCGQMGGLVLVDERGQPQTPYYSWRDQRVLDRHPSGEGSFFEVFRRRLRDEDVTAVGRELRAGSTITLLSWLKETGQPPRRDLYPVTLVDAVVANLCESAPVTEPTQALGLLDLGTLDWHTPLFDAAGVAGVRLSRIAPVTDAVGTCRIAGRELRCHPAVGDQQAALVGVGLQDDELSINCSTGSQVSRIAERFVPGDYQTRPFFGGRLINTLTHLPAGRSLNVLVDLLCELATAEGVKLSRAWETIARQSSIEPTAELDVNLAFFSGPLGDRGHIGNITTENLTVAALFRAAFRNMAENYAHCARRVSAGRPWTTAVLSGGLTQKLTVLRDLIAGRLGTPIRESEEPEETLAGLLQLGRTRAEHFPDGSRLMGLR